MLIIRVFLKNLCRFSVFNIYYFPRLYCADLFVLQEYSLRERCFKGRGGERLAKTRGRTRKEGREQAKTSNVLAGVSFLLPRALALCVLARHLTTPLSAFLAGFCRIQPIKDLRNRFIFCVLHRL